VHATLRPSEAIVKGNEFTTPTNAEPGWLS
jgi:hypothetical protein